MEKNNIDALCLQETHTVQASRQTRDMYTWLFGGMADWEAEHLNVRGANESVNTGVAIVIKNKLLN